MSARHRLMMLLFVAATALAGDFSFSRVQLSEVDDQVTLDADIRYTLGDKPGEALENGVPLTFVTHIEIRDSEAWIWQADLVDLRLRSTLSYHPLSGLYELRQLDSGHTQQFATREAALRALGELRELKLVPSSELRKDTSYTVHLETYLDLEALPLTLRPVAHITPSWHLESDEWERPLTP